MKTGLNLLLFSSLSVGLLAATPRGVAAGASGPLTISVKPEAGRLEIFHRDRKLLVYAFAAGQFKPYVKEFYTLKGDNLLLDSPPDHVHHHGLMYAIRVNGINFWEEANQPGYEKPVQLLSQSTGNNPAGLPQASFTQLIHWVAQKDRDLSDTKPAALLIERRTLTLTVDEAQQEVALRWQSDFEVGPAAAKATLAGANYHGLGARFPRTFDRVARHLNSENAPYPTKGKQDVLAAKWSAVAFAAEGREMTLAMFGRPAETRGTTKFFSMLDPFAYLSVTQNLDQAPLEYAAGDKFSLRYLVAAYPAVKSPEFLQQRQQKWEGGK